MLLLRSDKNIQYPKRHTCACQRALQTLQFFSLLKIANLPIRNICRMKLQRKHTFIIKSFCVQKARCIHSSSSKIKCSFIFSLKILWLTIVNMCGFFLHSRLSPTNSFKHTVKCGYCSKSSKNTCMKLALSLVKSATNYRASLKRVRKNI